MADFGVTYPAKKQAANCEVLKIMIRIQNNRVRLPSLLVSHLRQRKPFRMSGSHNIGIEGRSYCVVRYIFFVLSSTDRKKGHQGARKRAFDNFLALPIQASKSAVNYYCSIRPLRKSYLSACFALVIVEHYFSNDSMMSSPCGIISLAKTAKLIW